MSAQLKDAFRSVLRQWELEFVAQNGRKPAKGDIPIAELKKRSLGACSTGAAKPTRPISESPVQDMANTMEREGKMAKGKKAKGEKAAKEGRAKGERPRGTRSKRRTEIRGGYQPINSMPAPKVLEVEPVVLPGLAGGAVPSAAAADIKAHYAQTRCELQESARSGGPKRASKRPASGHASASRSHPAGGRTVECAHSASPVPNETALPPPSTGVAKMDVPALRPVSNPPRHSLCCVQVGCTSYMGHTRCNLLVRHVTAAAAATVLGHTA
jgi:hypothetical protein